MAKGRLKRQEIDSEKFRQVVTKLGEDYFKEIADPEKDGRGKRRVIYLWGENEEAKDLFREGLQWHFKMHHRGETVEVVRGGRNFGDKVKAYGIFVDHYWPKVLGEPHVGFQDNSPSIFNRGGYEGSLANDSSQPNNSLSKKVSCGKGDGKKISVPGFEYHEKLFGS